MNEADRAEQALAAEPSPMVRLTDEEIFAIRNSTLGPAAWGIKDFANAIMDAMQAKNGGAA